MIIRFGPFSLDGRSRELVKGGQPIHLSPKAFDLLALLATRRPEAISKAEIHERLWPDTFVSDVSIAVLVAELRRALGDTVRPHAFVRTVHRFGYAFSAAAADGAASLGNPNGRATCWLTWGGERALLRAGENVIGRDADADVRVEAVGVSRRHALIAVDGEEIELRDLASKNGTYVDGRRVTHPVPLSDGAEIRLGSTPVLFRRIGSRGSTVTLL